MAVKREQVVQTAEKYVARGKIEPAIREYRKLLEENPNDINTLNRVGDLYARIQRIDEAVDFFNQIAEQYAGEGFFVKAIAIYKKIIKLDPTRLDVYENLAELYHRQGLVTEARTQYQVLADYYQKHENATSTIAIYQKMAQLEPNNPTYHVKLAELYQQQKLIEKAMGEYRIIAELMIDHGHPQEAAQVYERALAIDSSNLAFITDAALKLKEAAGAAVAQHFLSIAVERNPQAAQVSRLIGGNLASAEAAAALGTADSLADRDERDERDERDDRIDIEDDGDFGVLGGAGVSGLAAFDDLADSDLDAGHAAPASAYRDLPSRGAPGGDERRADSSSARDIGGDDLYLPMADLSDAAPEPSPWEPRGASGEPSRLPLATDAELDLDMEIELDLGADLLAVDDLGDLPPALDGMPGTAERPVGRQVPGALGMSAEPAFEIEEEGEAITQPAALSPRPQPAAERDDHGDAFVDDLEDVFVLDIEDDEEPASLVKPPPDMLQQPRRPSWARGAGTAPDPVDSASAARAADGSALPAVPEAEALAPLSELSDLPDFGDIELDNPFAAFATAPPRTLLGDEAPPAPAAGPLLPALPADFDGPSAGAAPAAGPFANLHDEPPASGFLSAGEAAADRAAEDLDATSPAPMAQPLKLDRELLERTAAELMPQSVERYEDLVSEAEVLAKYGLEEKALERLRDAVRIKPRSFAAYLLLIQLNLERGRHARVLELANQVSNLAAETGDRDPWIKIRRRLLATGYRLDGERVAAIPQTLPGMETPQRLPRPRNLTSGVPVYHPDPLPAPATDGANVSSPTVLAPAVPAARSLQTAAAGATADALSGAVAAAPAAPARHDSPADGAPPLASPPAAPPPPSRPTRKKADGGFQQLLDGLVGRGGGRGAKAAKKTATDQETPAIPATAAASAPLALSGQPTGPVPADLAATPTPPPPHLEVSAPEGKPEAETHPETGTLGEPGGVDARDRFELDPLLPPDEPPAPAPTVAAPPAAGFGGIFNPLDIGAMVESEEIDWDDDSSPQPGFGRPANAGAALPLGESRPFPQPPPPFAAPGAPAAATATPAHRRGAGGAPVPPLPASAAPPAGAANSGAGAAASLDDTGMSWLDEADSDKDNKSGARAASLFDEEEDFFDLAGELEQELSQEAAFQGENLLVQQEQSLEEIVEGFKRGVAEHLSPTDYDTHFNLGIAYREMGLLDEAIGEFQLSAKDARYLVQCCSMLGLCFLDKGLPELAVKWYMRGLEAETISDDDTLGLLYDMGCSYLAMGDSATAYKTFVDVYGMNTNYRDVVARLEELGQSH